MNESGITWNLGDNYKYMHFEKLRSWLKVLSSGLTLFMAQALNGPHTAKASMIKARILTRFHSSCHAITTAIAVIT